MPISDPQLEENFLYNKKWAKPAKSYDTKLSADDERAYRVWLEQLSSDAGRPFSADDPTYDMRGFFKKNPSFVIKEGAHLPDTYKTPYHPTFSKESKYATSAAPYWNDDNQLIDPETKLPTPGYFKQKLMGNE